MKANLTIEDRFAILSMLPVEGNFVTLKIVRELREQLSLTQAEIKEYKVEQVGDRITWNDGVKKTEMEFGAFNAGMIKDALKTLNDNAKLEERHYTIYEQFVGG